MNIAAEERKEIEFVAWVEHFLQQAYDEAKLAYEETQRLIKMGVKNLLMIHSQQMYYLVVQHLTNAIRACENSLEDCYKMEVFSKALARHIPKIRGVVNIKELEYEDRIVIKDGLHMETLINNLVKPLLSDAQKFMLAASKAAAAQNPNALAIEFNNAEERVRFAMIRLEKMIQVCKQMITIDKQVMAETSRVGKPVYMG